MTDSTDRYPKKERLATDRATQLAWIIREMGYSRDKKDLEGKALGYEEKQTRLRRQPGDSMSVFGFMSGYWKRFRTAEENRAMLDQPIMVTKSLQAEGKVVAGLADKIAFSFWLETQHSGAVFDPELALNSATSLLAYRVGEIEDWMYRPEELAAFNESESFAGTPMGVAVLDLHKAYAINRTDTENLAAIAVHGAAAGLLMWQAHANSLAAQGYDVTLPQPGEPGKGGNITDWVN